MTIRIANKDDLPLLVEIYSDAFRNDPVMNWSLGGPKAIENVFSSLLRHVFLPRGTVEVLDNQVATAWLHSRDSKELPPLAGLKLMLTVIYKHGFGVVGRISDLEKAMKHHTPKEPHLYLFAIGAMSKSRGKGAGARLLDNMLSKCDNEKECVYLENSNPNNHDFYVSRGFTTRSTFRPASNAPIIEGMWREPL